MALPIDELVHRLKGVMVDTGVRAGWDRPNAWIGAKDPAGTIRLCFMAAQGNLRVSTALAEEYLEWLMAGNTGTIMKWASLHGKKIGKPV